MSVSELSETYFIKLSLNPQRPNADKPLCLIWESKTAQGLRENNYHLFDTNKFSNRYLRYLRVNDIKINISFAGYARDFFMIISQ